MPTRTLLIAERGSEWSIGCEGTTGNIGGFSTLACEIQSEFFEGYIGLGVDVTERKLAEEALSQVSGRLIEAQEKERNRIGRTFTTTSLNDSRC
ncbi:MAG TPA: hypothetical protein VFE61_07035 [Candidatus Sulfotelmatobacter sp.]|jgi:hypothetical protein|nr:hypothetical protein [Candidatus Sulfotelmatobacter sp.]